MGVPGPGLTEGKSVYLDVGTGTKLLDCTVVAFLGSAVLVMPRIPPSEAEREWVLSGSTDLLVDFDDHLEAHPSTVREAGQALIVHVKELASLGQRRWWSRGPITLDARLVPQPPGPAPTDTTTADVSAGGVQVNRVPGMPIWPRYELTLSGTGLTDPIVVEAVPARVLADRFGLRFTRIDAADRQRLAQLVLRFLTTGSIAPDP